MIRVSLYVRVPQASRCLDFPARMPSPLASYTFEPRPYVAAPPSFLLLAKVASPRSSRPRRARYEQIVVVTETTYVIRHDIDTPLNATKQRHSLEGRRAAADVGEVDEHVGAERVGDVVADVLERAFARRRRLHDAPEERHHREATVLDLLLLHLGHVVLAEVGEVEVLAAGVRG